MYRIQTTRDFPLNQRPGKGTIPLRTWRGWKKQKAINLRFKYLRYHYKEPQYQFLTNRLWLSHQKFKNTWDLLIIVVILCSFTYDNLLILPLEIHFLSNFEEQSHFHKMEVVLDISEVTKLFSRIMQFVLSPHDGGISLSSLSWQRW